MCGNWKSSVKCSWSDHESLISRCRRIWTSDWLIKVTPPARHVTTRNNHSTTAVFHLFVYVFRLWYWWPFCQKILAYAAVNCTHLQFKGWGQTFHSINTIVMGLIWIKCHNIPTPACKHVLVVGYVWAHIRVLFVFEPITAFCLLLPDTSA